MGARRRRPDGDADSTREGGRACRGARVQRPGPPLAGQPGALAVSLITIGKVGDRFGHKKVFLTGITGFALSSAAIGLSGTIASSITLVIAFRALQGVFGAMLQPTALAILRNTFPAEKLNGAIGIWGAVIGASTAAGPIVGGLLVQHIGWESCFYAPGSHCCPCGCSVPRPCRPAWYWSSC